MRTLPRRFTAPAAPTVDAAATPPVPAPIPVLPVATPAGQDWPGRDLLDNPMLARVLMAAWGGDPAIVVKACPGSGKSRLAALLAAALAHRVGLRVAVAAQTREQAAELARRITAVSERAALIVSSTGKKPVNVDGVRTVTGHNIRWSQATGGEILIGTAARWLYVDPSMAGADLLIVDEAWQCTYADLGALGALARQVLCVGDPGQVAPVVTGSTLRWEGQESGWAKGLLVCGFSNRGACGSLLPHSRCDPAELLQAQAKTDHSHSAAPQ